MSILGRIKCDVPGCIQTEQLRIADSVPDGWALLVLQTPEKGQVHTHNAHLCPEHTVATFLWLTEPQV